MACPYPSAKNGRADSIAALPCRIGRSRRYTHASGCRPAPLNYHLSGIMKSFVFARTLVIIISLFMSSLVAASDPTGNEGTRKYLGVFSNVQVSPNSGDCGGHSLRLWETTGPNGTQKLSGSFYAAAGTCPGLRMELVDVSYAAQTGALEFTAASAEDQDPHPVQFKGSLTKNVVRGTFSYLTPKTGAIQSMGEIVLLPVSDKQWSH